MTYQDSLWPHLLQPCLAQLRVPTVFPRGCDTLGFYLCSSELSKSPRTEQTTWNARDVMCTEHLRHAWYLAILYICRVLSGGSEGIRPVVRVKRNDFGGRYPT